MKKIVLAVVVAAFASSPAFAAGTPRSVFMKIYSLWLSPNADCSSAINVFDSSAAMEFDMVSGPTIGGGNPPDGTYQCLIMKISDQVRFVVNAAEGSCTAGYTGTLDLCRTAGGASQTTPFDGTNFLTNTTCTTGVDNTIYLYISTGASCTTGCGGAFKRPATAGTATEGINLGNAFVVSGSTAGTFVADFTGKVDGSGATCDVQAPRFTFR